MRKKVLILEDMETTRTALKRIVESFDYAITAYEFSEVGPALACIMENHIDLFFVDIILIFNQIWYCRLCSFAQCT